MLHFLVILILFFSQVVHSNSTMQFVIVDSIKVFSATIHVIYETEVHIRKCPE